MPSNRGCRVKGTPSIAGEKKKGGEAGVGRSESRTQAFSGRTRCTRLRHLDGAPGSAAWESAPPSQSRGPPEPLAHATPHRRCRTGWRPRRWSRSCAGWTRASPAATGCAQGPCWRSGSGGTGHPGEAQPTPLGPRPLAAPQDSPGLAGRVQRQALQVPAETPGLGHRLGHLDFPAPNSKAAHIPAAGVRKD